LPLQRATLPFPSALRARALAAAAALLAACATVPPPPETAIPAVSPLADAAFALDGRLSARRGADAVAVGFAWVHEPPRDTLVVTSPLGQTLAELEGDIGRRVRLTLADGRSSEDDDWVALTGRMLGFPLPVDALAAWVRASPHGGSAYAVEPDGSGRPALLRQDGWEIAFGYTDAEARRPARLRLSTADTEVRIVIERWR
jgi:outer membrane lipoprotein LolB